MKRDGSSKVVAGEVRAWMARRQLSAAMVARELGWTEIYISRRLRAIVPFDVQDLTALAELLEVPVTVFFQPPQIASYDRGAAAASVIEALAAHLSSEDSEDPSWPLTQGVRTARSRLFAAAA